MRKRAVIIVLVILVILGISIGLTLFSVKNVAATSAYSLTPCYDLSANSTVNSSPEFLKNMYDSLELSKCFLSKLPYDGNYVFTAAMGEYTVDGIRADGYPDYFAGTYINEDGKLIVVIKESYYEGNYRNRDWYQELSDLLGSTDFGCKFAEYNYTELVNQCSELAFGGTGKAIADSAVEMVSFRIGTYENRVLVGVRTEADATMMRNIIQNDICTTVVVGDVSCIDQ